MKLILVNDAIFGKKPHKPKLHENDGFDWINSIQYTSTDLNIAADRLLLLVKEVYDTVEGDSIITNFEDDLTDQIQRRGNISDIDVESFKQILKEKIMTSFNDNHEHIYNYDLDILLDAYGNINQHSAENEKKTTFLDKVKSTINIRKGPKPEDVFLKIAKSINCHFELAAINNTELELSKIKIYNRMNNDFFSKIQNYTDNNITEYSRLVDKIEHSLTDRIEIYRSLYS